MQSSRSAATDSSNGSVLVTGGAGYIGSHTVRALRAAGRDVVVLDSLELGRAEAVIDAPLVVGDIADRDLVIATCKEHAVSQVVHFAAYKSVGESMQSPAKYWRNNVAGTVELVGTGHHTVHDAESLELGCLESASCVQHLARELSGQQLREAHAARVGQDAEACLG